MERNTILFWLNGDILKELAKNHLYEIELGYVLNSNWHVEITLEDVDYDGFVFSARTVFTLVRENGSWPISVNFKLIRNSELGLEKILNFKEGSSSMFIFNMEFYEWEGSKLEFCFEQKTHCSNQPKEVIPSVAKDNFREDMLSLLRKERFADVTLKCGSESVCAHKAILCARSPVFEAMFGHQMHESKTNTVSIEDMDTSVFRALINFVYGSQIKMTSINFACDLLNAAEKYQMKGLKEMCIEYLESVLSTENAIQLFELADLYDKYLKRRVIAYMRNDLNALISSKEWQDLKSRKPALALEVYVTTRTFK